MERNPATAAHNRKCCEDAKLDESERNSTLQTNAPQPERTEQKTKWNNMFRKHEEERREEEGVERRQEAAAGRAVLVEMSPVKMLSCKTSAALVTEPSWSESGHEPDANREDATWVSGKQNSSWKLGRRKRNNQCG